MVIVPEPFYHHHNLPPPMQPSADKKIRQILEELHNYKQQDYSFTSGHILGSMCTQPHPIALQAYQRFMETNLGDPELFPGTKQIEKKYIHFIQNLLHAPKHSDGLIVSGGTESNITAIWLAKQLTQKKIILLPKSAHFSFKKIASIMEMKLVDIPLTKQYTMDIVALKKAAKQDIAAVLGIAGSTELGTIDPHPEINDICQEQHLFFHVDAAFGGYVIPFLKQIGYNIPDFDFHLPAVSSIGVDAHKMGSSAIPLGVLIVRDKQWLDEISVETEYISSKTQAGLQGTRSGGPVAAAYAVAQYLGNKGYKQQVKQCMENTKYAQQRIQELGLSLLINPTMNVLGIRLTNPILVMEKLAQKGWRVNKLPQLSCIRLVIMPHVTRQVIDKFIPVLEKTCKEVGEL